MNNHSGTHISLFLSDEFINKVSEADRRQLERIARWLFWEYQIREPERAKHLASEFIFDHGLFSADGD